MLVLTHMMVIKQQKQKKTINITLKLFKTFLKKKKTQLKDFNFLCLQINKLIL